MRGRDVAQLMKGLHSLQQALGSEVQGHHQLCEFVTSLTLSLPPSKNHNAYDLKKTKQNLHHAMHGRQK